MQQYYGIDLDAAMSGQHTAQHIAALVSQLPRDARLRVKQDKDAQWALSDVLTAILINNFNSFVWGMSDKRKRGKRPDLIGPSWMTKGRTRSLPARVLPISKLMEELNKPRGANG